MPRFHGEVQSNSSVAYYLFSFRFERLVIHCFYRVPLNYLILNLAVADIIVALFLVPWHVFIHSKNHPDGLTGTVLCKLLTGGTLIWIGLLVSVFTLVAISFERYCAVVRTDAYQRQFTVQKLKVRLVRVR